MERFRLCDEPKPQHNGLTCEGSETGSQQEMKSCFLKKCPQGMYVSISTMNFIVCSDFLKIVYFRYRNDVDNEYFCEEGLSLSGKINWPKTLGGIKHTAYCPAGTIGHAHRFCTKAFVWLDEDLSSCVTAEISVNIH